MTSSAVSAGSPYFLASGVRFVVSILSTNISILSILWFRKLSQWIGLSTIRFVKQYIDNRDMSICMDDFEMPKESEKKAIERYRTTEKGKAAQRRSQKNYAETEKGAIARKRASEKFEAENAEARREYKRKKQAEYRAKRKQQQNSLLNPEAAPEKQNNVTLETVASFSEGCVVQTQTGQIGQVIAILYAVKFEDGSVQTFSSSELTRHDSPEAVQKQSRK